MTRHENAKDARIAERSASEQQARDKIARAMRRMRERIGYCYKTYGHASDARSTEGRK